MSASRLPKATRLSATNCASVTARRISPAARTPLDRRELLTMSAICRNPAPGAAMGSSPIEVGQRRPQGGSRRTPWSGCRACPSGGRSDRRSRVPSGPVARQQEERRRISGRARRVGGAGEHHGQGGIRHSNRTICPPVSAPGAVIAPASAVTVGRADIGAGALLGHEHRALVERCRRRPGSVRAGRWRAIRSVGRRSACEACGSRLSVMLTGQMQAELGLREEIGQQVFGRRRHGGGPAEDRRHDATSRPARTRRRPAAPSRL